MKPTLWMLGLALGLVGTLGAQTDERSVTLVSLLNDRPVFSYASEGWTQSRTVAPGTRIRLAPGEFSGLADKRLKLTPGAVYYWARIQGPSAVYRLGEDQILVVNQSGQVVNLTFSTTPAVSGLVASGSFALGAATEGQGLEVTWETEPGKRGTLLATPGQLYRLVLDSPEGLGTTIALQLWE